MNINDLPNEMLENIFRFLPFRDLKIASMVCTQWHRTIFSRTRMQNVILELITARFRNLPLVELEISERSYRNIRVLFNSVQADQQSQWYFLKLLRNYRNSVRRLDIVWKIYDKPLDLVLLVKIAEMVPMLQQLNIFDHQNNGCEENSNRLTGIPPMKFLTKLRLPRCVMDDFGFDLARFAPNTKNIDVDFGKGHPWEALGALQRQLLTMCIKMESKENFVHFWTLNATKLQKLRLIRHQCEELGESNDFEVVGVRTFFLNCPVLTVLKLDLKVPSEVVQIIVESCLQLESLMLCCIDDGWQMLSIVCNLKNLKNLSLIAATFHPLLSAYQTLRLPGLQHITLCAPDFLDVSQFFEQLNRAAPNLATLQLIHYSQICDEDLNIRTLQALFQSRMQMLRKLILFDFCCVFPSHLIDRLKLFPRLSELWLTSRALSPYFEPVTVPAIRRLAVDAPLNQFLLRSLLEVFPSLTRLEVSEGNGFLDEKNTGHAINFCKKRSLLEDRADF